MYARRSRSKRCLSSSVAIGNGSARSGCSGEMKKESLARSCVVGLVPVNTSSAVAK